MTQSTYVGEVGTNTSRTCRMEQNFLVVPIFWNVSTSQSYTQNSEILFWKMSVQFDSFPPNFRKFWLNGKRPWSVTTPVNA